jgi:hypothetical protein
MDSQTLRVSTFIGTLCIYFNIILDGRIQVRFNTQLGMHWNLYSHGGLDSPSLLYLK